MPLLIENSSPLATRPCGCGSGLAALIARAKRSPGLGDASSGIVPKGSTLVYNCTFTPGWVSPTATPASIAAQVAQNVQQNSGIRVVGSNASTNAFAAQAAFTLTLFLNQDYTDPQMVQSVMDSAVNAVTGGVVSSNISVSSGPSAGQGNAPLPGLPGAGPAPPGTPDPNAPFDLANFLATYGGWIVAGVVGFVLVRKIL